MGRKGITVSAACLAGACLLAGAALWHGDVALETPRVVAALLAPAAPAKPEPVARAAAPVPVHVARSRAEDVPLTLSGIGTVQAFNTVNVKARVDGAITQILFTEGQAVKAGDPLAIIDPRPYAAQLAQAQATRAKDQAMLEGAALDLARYQDLATRSFASRQQVDQQKAMVDQYRAQIAADEAQIGFAQTQLDFATIRSPIDGRAGIRQIDTGNFVHASDNAPIVVITQLQPISAVFTLAAGAVAAAHLTPGQPHIPVVALGPDDSTELDRGTLDLVDNQVDQTTGTIKLKANFPNPALKLWPGNFINGRVIVGTEKNAVTVPAAALRHGPRGDYVWIVHDGIAESHGVTAADGGPGRAMITRGLRPGETVVIDGYYRLENKSPVEIVRDRRPATASSG
jgi:membrane fusion protein, multidrug efflux system